MILFRSSHDGEGIRASGFTLVEILVALAILMSVLVIVLSAFTGAQRAREILMSKETALRQTRILLERAGTDISGAFVSTVHETTALSCRQDRFSGMSASTLQFTAFALPDASDMRPSGGIVRLRYSPRLAPDGGFIEIHREQGDIPLIDSRVPDREARIAERLRGFRVELYDGQKWVTEWPSGQGGKMTMPRKAAVIVTDAEGNEFRRVVPIPLAGQEGSVLFSGKRPKR